MIKEAIAKLIKKESLTTEMMEQVMEEIRILVEQGMRAVIFGLQIRFVNVWEAIFVHACKS